MSENQVTIRVRLANARAFRAEAKLVANSVDDIGDEADQSSRRLERLKAQLIETRAFSVMVKAGEDTQESLSGMGGGIRGVWKLAIIAAPAILALGASLVALGGSAGAALGGAGAVGIGGVGALAFGIAGLGFVTAGAVHGLTKVKTALDAYILAVEQFGHGSAQASDAQAKLNAVVAQSGGPAILRAIQGWRSLTSAFAAKTGSARGSILGSLSDTIATAKRILPTFADETNKGTLALRHSWAGFLSVLGGRESLGTMRVLGDTFRKGLSPWMHAFTSLFVIFSRIARASAPYVLQLAHAVERMTRGWRVASGDSDRLSQGVATLVGHMKSWLHFGAELTRVVFHLFSGGAREGQSMTDSMTRILNKWDRWLVLANKSGKSGKFFHEMRVGLGGILAAIGPLVPALGDTLAAMMPGLLEAVKALAPWMGLFGSTLTILANAANFLSPLIGPLTDSFIAWKFATLALNTAVTILDAELWANPIGLVILAVVAVAAAFYLAYKKVGWFHKGVEAVFGWVRSHWPLLLVILVGPIGLAIGEMIRHWDGFVGFFKRLPGRIGKAARGLFDGVKGAFADAINWIIRKWNGFHLGFGAVKVLGRTVIPGVSLDTPDIPLIGGGGAARAPSTHDRLPRVNAPRRAPRSVAPGSLRESMGDAGAFDVRVPVYLHGRQIAEAVGKDTRDRRNRK